jgi:hypothetical protein
MGADEKRRWNQDFDPGAERLGLLLNMANGIRSLMAMTPQNFEWILTRC